MAENFSHTFFLPLEKNGIYNKFKMMKKFKSRHF